MDNFCYLNCIIKRLYKIFSASFALLFYPDNLFKTKTSIKIQEKLDRNNQQIQTRKNLLYFLIVLTVLIYNCTGLGEENIRPESGSVLVGMLRDEYAFFNLYVPPDSAFIVKDTSSNYYWFWDGGHLSGNSDDICNTCAGRALNTGDRAFSGIAMLDWDRHSESYTTNLGSYADLMVEQLASLGWDTLNWAWPPLISSAWRNPDRNDRILGSSSTSKHMFGRAIDFEGVDATQLDLIFQAVDNAGGTAIPENYPTGWIHSKWPPY